MWGEGSFGRQSQAMKEYRASYCTGFGAAVGRRLSATAKLQLEAAQTTAMVWVRKTDAAIQAYTGRFTGKTTVKNEYNRHNASAFAKGMEQGGNVALTSKTLNGR
jgi:hypothetical protein